MQRGHLPNLEGATRGHVAALRERAAKAQHGAEATRRFEDAAVVHTQLKENPPLLVRLEQCAAAPRASNAAWGAISVPLLHAPRTQRSAIRAAHGFVHGHGRVVRAW